jgi:hypothetical protein
MSFFLVYLMIGLIFNLIGPLANHLRKEDKHSLKENKHKSWFYKYSFILVMRIFMTLIYPLFYFSYYILKRKPAEPVSFEDELNTSLVKRLRTIGKHIEAAPTDKTSDEKIIEIYQLICSSFRNESNKRNERIPANSLNTIAMKFFNIYEEFGEDFMQDHLKYELKKYLKEGLRPEYQKGISLF